MSNLFATAIDKKELLGFALGEGSYYLADRTGSSEHWVLGSWNKEVMEVVDSDPAQGAAGVRSMFAALVGNSPESTALRIWPLIDHLQQYWTQRHGGWLDFELGRIVEKIAVAVDAERERCRRGIGGADLSTIELTIRRIQAHGGLAELAG